MAKDYISLQGKFHLAHIVNDVVGALRELGNVPEFEVEVTADVIDHKESTSGQRTTDFTMVQTTGVNFSGQLEEVNKENLKYLLSGESFDIPTETVTGKSLGTVTVNQKILLDAYNLTSVVVKDSTATPVVVASNKYVLDPVFGTIKFTDIAGLTMPITIDYTSGAVTQTTIASDLEQEYMLYFEGVNTVNGEKVAMKLWRTKKSPEVTFPLIHEELGQYQIQGQALSDVSKGSDSKLGFYGHFVNIPATT